MDLLKIAIWYALCMFSFMMFSSTASTVLQKSNYKLPFVEISFKALPCIHFSRPVMISSKKIDINTDVSNLEPNLTQTCIKPIINFRGDYTDFFHNYLVCNLPVVISDVSSHWRCSKLWVKNGLPNIDYLRTSYGKPAFFPYIIDQELIVIIIFHLLIKGNATVSVADCNEQYFNAQRKRNMKFRDFTDYWMKITQNDHPYSQPCLYLKVCLHF